MATTRNLITAEAHGPNYGITFDDSLYIGDLADAVLTRITMLHGGYINSLIMYYCGSHVPATNRGSGESQSDIDIGPGEWITTISGIVNNNVIAMLSFVNNKGSVFGPYGRGEGTSRQPFEWHAADNVSAPLASRMGLLYFSGNTSGNSVCRLRPTFALYGSAPNLCTNVKFEERVPTSLLTGAIFLSSFARNIMSPVITLKIGPSAVVFHSYEATICRIPFFRAALQGEFREAAEKLVSLPEEDPEVFCALLEHLTIGSYTYTYDAASTAVVDGFPVTDLAEGCYHVSVYAVGFRYDWQPLVEDAVSNFLVVLPKLEGMDVVRLWKAAYENGLTVAVCVGEGRLAAFEKVLPGLLKGVFAGEAAEMEIAVAELPALAIDFMKLLVAEAK